MEQTPCQALLLQINKHICQYQCIDQGVLHNAILYLTNDDCYLATCSEKSDLIDKQKAKIIDSPSNQEYKPTVPNNMTSERAMLQQNFVWCFSNAHTINAVRVVLVPYHVINLT